MINNLEKGSTHRMVCAPLGPRIGWIDLLRYFLDFIDAGAVRVFEAKPLDSSTNRFWCVDP